MTLLLRRSVLAAKIEATIGTDATPVAADAAMNVFNAVMAPEIDMEQREGQGGFDMLGSIPSGRRAKCTFRTNLEWDGSSTEPLWAETFFPACGWVKSGQVYTPRTEAPGANVKTLTISHYVDGVLRKMTGAVGTFTVNLPTGKPGYIDWEFSGVWAGETDAAILTPTYPTATTYKFSSGVCQLNNVNLQTQSVTINAGNTITMREDASTQSGYISGIITNRMPTLTLDPEKKLVATQDRHGAWLAGTLWAVEAHCGGVGNSLLQFDAPQAQIQKITFADREKLVVDQIELLACKNGASQDQSLSITFTAAV